MAKPQKRQTPFIRQCVKLWFAENKHVKDFSTPLLAGDIQSDHIVFKDDYDVLSKGVSNELQRLEKNHLLKSRKGNSNDNPHPYGWGRPPRVYSFTLFGEKELTGFLNAVE